MTTTPYSRIGGWLFAPLAWLLLSLLSSTLALVMYAVSVLLPETHQVLSQHSTQLVLLWYLSFACTLVMWGYTLWLAVAFFKRRRLVPRHYIIWLLLSVLLALKGFAFSPVSDELAVRQLIFPLLAAALLAPYFRRARRVKETFINS